LRLKIRCSAIAILALLILFTAPVVMAMTDAECGESLVEFEKQKLQLVVDLDGRLDALNNRTDLDTDARVKAKSKVIADTMAKSRAIATLYRDPAVKYIIAKVNGQLPADKHIRETAGSKPGDPGYRGALGDIDLGGPEVAVGLVRKKFKKIMKLVGNKVTIKKQVAYITINSLDITIHKDGNRGQVGTPEYEIRVQGDARLPETYLFLSMDPKQAGRIGVEVHDHLKKAAKGIKLTPTDLISRHYRDALQTTAKGTLKSITAAGLSDADLRQALTGTGLKPGAFKAMLDGIWHKDYLDAKVAGLENIEQAKKFKKAVLATLVAAEAKSWHQATKEITSLKDRITKAQTNGDAGTVLDLQRQLIDTQIKLKANVEANHNRYGDLLPERKITVDEFSAPAKMVDFVRHMATTPNGRRVVTQLLNDMAAKDPDAAVKLLESLSDKERQLLLTDDDFRKFRGDLMAAATKIKAAPASRLETIKLFAGTCKARIKRIDSMMNYQFKNRFNTYMDKQMSASAFGQKFEKAMGVYGKIDEARAYYNAFQRGRLTELATEVARRRVMFMSTVEFVYKEEYYMATWDIICTVCPKLGLATALVRMELGMLESSMDYFWTTELNLLEDQLYESAEWKLEDVTSLENAKLGTWRLVSVQDTRNGVTRTFKRDELLGGVMKLPLDSLEVEMLLEREIEKCDPVLGGWRHLMKHPIAKASAHKEGFRAKYMRRWESLKIWWVDELIRRLEERKAAEDALLRGQLPTMFAELQRITRDLEIEDQVYKAMDNEWKDKNYQVLLAWLRDVSRSIFSQASAETYVEKAAQIVIRYLECYRTVHQARQAIEEAAFLDGTKDQKVLRLLTGVSFLDGEPKKDLAVVSAWQKLPETIRLKTATELIAIKKKYVAHAALDNKLIDIPTLKDVVRHRVWEEAWSHAFKNLQRAPAQTPGKKIPTGSECTAFRKEHRAKAEQLIADFEAYYANQNVARIEIVVLQQIGSRRTVTPVPGAAVKLLNRWGTSLRCNRARAGVFTFEMIAPGAYGVEVGAPGFVSDKGAVSITLGLVVRARTNDEPPLVIRKTVYLLPVAATVSVRVADDRDQPVPHAQVGLSTDVPESQAASVGVDSSGKCAFPDLYPGSYQVTVSAPGFTAPDPMPMFELFPGQAASNVKQPVLVIMKPNLATVAISVANNLSVPVDGATVELDGKRKQTDAHGVAVFDNVRPSTDRPHPVIAAKTGYPRGGIELVLQPDQPDTFVTRSIILRGDGRLTVTVLDDESQKRLPVKGAKVSLNYDATIADKTVNDKGMADFANLPPSFIYVQASADGFLASPDKEVRLGPELSAMSKTVTVRLTRGMIVDVLVKDEKGALLPDAHASIDGGPFQVAATGIKEFRPVKKGEHKFRAKARGYAEAEAVYLAEPEKNTTGKVVIALKPARTIVVEAREKTPPHALITGSRLTLLLDGQDVGTGPGPAYLFADLEPGIYSSRAIAPCYSPGSSSSVTFKEADAGIHATLEVWMEQTSASATLIVTITGSGADTARTRISGPAGTFSDSGPLAVTRGLTTGTYKLIISSDGCKLVTRTVELAPTTPHQVYRVTVQIDNVAEVVADPFVPLDLPSDIGTAMKRTAIAAGLRGMPGHAGWTPQDGYANMTREERESMWLLGIAMGSLFSGAEVSGGELEGLRNTVPEHSYTLGGIIRSGTQVLMCGMSVNEYKDEAAARKTHRKWARFSISIMSRRGTIESDPETSDGLVEIFNYIAKSTQVSQDFIRFHGGRALRSSSHTVGELAQYQNSVSRSLQWRQGKYVIQTSISGMSGMMSLMGSTGTISIPVKKFMKMSHHLYREVMLVE